MSRCWVLTTETQIYLSSTTCLSIYLSQAAQEAEDREGDGGDSGEVEDGEGEGGEGEGGVGEGGEGEGGVAYEDDEKFMAAGVLGALGGIERARAPAPAPSR